MKPFPPYFVRLFFVISGGLLLGVALFSQAQVFALSPASPESFDLITCQESLAYYENEPRLLFEIYILSGSFDPLGPPRTLAAMLFVEWEGEREMVLSQNGSPEHVLLYLGPQGAHELRLRLNHPFSALRGRVTLRPVTQGRGAGEFTGVYHGSFEAKGLFGDLHLSRPMKSGRPGVVCATELVQ